MSIAPIVWFRGDLLRANVLVSGVPDWPFGDVDLLVYPSAGQPPEVFTGFKAVEQDGWINVDLSVAELEGYTPGDPAFCRLRFVNPSHSRWAQTVDVASSPGAASHVDGGLFERHSYDSSALPTGPYWSAPGFEVHGAPVFLQGSYVFFRYDEASSGWSCYKDLTTAAESGHPEYAKFHNDWGAGTYPDALLHSYQRIGYCVFEGIANKDSYYPEIDRLSMMVSEPSVGIPVSTTESPEPVGGPPLTCLSESFPFDIRDPRYLEGREWR